MKLAEEQITYIENYIKRNDVKYYEVYMEILDHMVLSVEAILENDKEISFEDAVVQAKKQFGKNGYGFQSFSEEKLNSFRERERTMYLKEIKKFFTFPKIVLTLIGFLGFVFFLGYFEKPMKTTNFFILILIIIAFSQLKFWYKNRKINGYKLIKNEYYFYGINSVAMWSWFNNMLSNDADSIYAKLFFSLTTTISFLSLLIFIQTRKKIDSEIQAYQQL